MKKIDYQAPEMEVVKLNNIQPLLTGSITEGDGSEAPGTGETDTF